MSNIVSFTIDGVKVEGTVGQTIMEAAEQVMGHSTHLFQRL